ncbi:hypothetical protein RDWZM_007584 [Blomia tropicalis]|uniref:ubiquitinyl hydrolase 1 n=1 Tax=Blomia tropicalis TaxID=40697 RepID=A0A9Q0M051_BLOTA|nr:hypothetical protein RDWZM_007584 [Blomia tropicalis]
MSYEFADKKNESVTNDRYSKIADKEDDCDLLLDGASHEKDDGICHNDNNYSTDQVYKSSCNTSPTHSESKHNSSTESSNIKTSSTATNVTTAERKSKTKQTSSHRSFDLSRFIRMLSFRKKRNKSKTSDSNSLNISQTIDPSKSSSTRPNKYRSLPKSLKSKVAKNDDQSDAQDKENDKTEEKKDEEEEKPNIFFRFVRTFSFLYKRNPNQTSNFKRSQSVQNYRTSRSPTIVTNHSRSLSSSTTNSPVKVYANNLKHSIASTDHIIKKDRNNVENSTVRRIPPSSHGSNQLDEINHRKPIQSSDITDSGDNNKNIQTTTTIANKPNLVTNETNSNANGRRRHLVISGLETPAVCGIQNHGNTCFINSVIQCLNNTDLLAEYFVFNHYRDDLHQNKKNGTRGELTEHLAILLKSLWSCMYSSDISMKFKKIVSKYGHQYNGYEQHDAQEFLLWLFDKCHEDLTAQSKSGNNKNSLLHFRKGLNNKKELQLSDETAAIESLAKYQTINSSSIIYDLFQGQLRSMLVCRNCDHYSKTFDPYLCISLPVPIRLTLTIFIHAIFLDRRPNHSGMYGISIEAAATLRELRDKVSRMLKIPEKRLILLQIDKRFGMIEFANDTLMIQEDLEDFETIYALETPIIPDSISEELLVDTREGDNEHENTMYKQMLTIVWLNRVGTGNDGSIFGPLFTSVVSRECSFRKLQSLILNSMSEFLIDQQNINWDELNRNINLRFRIVNGLVGKEYLSPELDHPLFVASVENALSKTENKRLYRGPYHLKIIVEWDADIRRSILMTDDLIDAIYEKNGMFVDKSVELAKECSNLNNHTTLQDCLDIYFREESLTAENAWMCPMCNSRQQCVKQLSVWTLPNIFIIHLKRFRFMSNIRRLKVNTVVEYPQNGLDMLKYVAQRKFNSDVETGNGVIPSMTNGPLENSSKFSHQRKLKNTIEETTYNLYGVCCHHGTMQGGHYTAYCKNPVDNCWYLFDDTKVIPVQEEAVVSADAYLLFYQKSSLSKMSNMEPKANHSVSSISSGYLSSVTGSNFNINHWSFHMPTFNYYNVNGNVANNYDKSSTLPNRRQVLQTNKGITSGNIINHHLSSIGHNYKNAKSSNNHEAIKHSPKTTFNSHLLPNSNKYMSDKTSSNNYHNTFPRIKSRQASH